MRMPSPTPIFFMREANLTVEGSMCGSDDFSSVRSSMSKNRAPGMCAFEEFGLRVAAGGRQVPARVEHDQIGGIEMRGEPIGIDDPLLGAFEHVSLSCSLVNAYGRRLASRARSDIGKSRRAPQGSRRPLPVQSALRGAEYRRKLGRRARQPGGNGQRLGFQKRRVEKPRLIARAAVAQDRHDRVTRPQLAGQAYGARRH